MRFSQKCSNQISKLTIPTLQQTTLNTLKYQVEALLGRSIRLNCFLPDSFAPNYSQALHLCRDCTFPGRRDVLSSPLCRGQSWPSKVDFSRGLIATTSPPRSSSRSETRTEERERWKEHETFDCIRESIESVGAQKGRPGQNKGTRLESLSARGSGQWVQAEGSGEYSTEAGESRTRVEARGKKTLTWRLFESWMAAAGRTNRQPLKT